MCLFNETAKLRLHQSPRPKTFQRGKAIPRGARVSLNISATLALFISLALACIVGSEYEQISQPRALGGLLLPSFQRYFVGLYRAAFASSKPTLTDEQVDAYIKDGYVVISGLLDSNELDNLVDAGERVVSNHIEKLGGKLKNGNFQIHEFGLILSDKIFRDVALHSRLPSAAAELLQLDRKAQNLRVLKDVFLAKGHDSTSSCGWHVDDQLFWPAAYQLPTSKVDQTGINAWIALDDMPIENGGSMAVSPASHAGDFPWRSEAYAALNFDDRLGSGISKDELVELIKSGKVDSCGLEKVAPHLYDDIELSKQEFNYKRGDVIFMNRWLFHKSTDVSDKGKMALQAIQESFNGDQTGDTLLKRYSLRYATGSNALPGGFVTEMSVLASDGHNLGKQLDDVEGEWYPECWPVVDRDVDSKLERLASTELPIAQTKLGDIMAEMMTLFHSR